jgi:putative transposase
LALSEDLNAQHLSLKVLAQAVSRGGITSNVLFHSGQGVQYAIPEFTTILKANEFRQRMSRRGNCWDNALAESFSKTLKQEPAIAIPFKHYQQARTRFFKFIELWYNRK